MLKTLAALAALLATPALAHDGPHVVGAYARVSGASATSGAIFFVIENHGEAEDRLIAAAADVAEKAELHTHMMDGNGVMKMQAIDSIVIPSKGAHALERGGDHVMLLGLKQPLQQGDTISLTLTFARGEVITLDVPVDNERAAGATAHGSHGHAAPSN